MTILAVDDRPKALSALVKAIRCAEPEAEVYAFSGSAEALRFARELCCDAAFLDIDMPEMDGLELAGVYERPAWPRENSGEGGEVRRREMKSSVRKAAVLLTVILAVLASLLWVSRACVRDYSQELYESISDSTAHIRAMLPELNGNEKQYIAALNRINRAKLNGVCYALEHMEEIPDGWLQKCCENADFMKLSISLPDGRTLEASLCAEEEIESGEQSGMLHYEQALADGRRVAVDMSRREIEAVVGSTVSWMRQIRDFQAGLSGFACVVSEDGTILSHPVPLLIGRAAFDMGAESARFGNLTLYPLKSESLSDRFFYSMVGTSAVYGGSTILCGVTLAEYILSALGMALLFPLLTLPVLWLLLRYLFLSRRQCALGGKKLAAVCALLLLICFVTSLYLQTVSSSCRILSTMDAHAEAVLNT